MAEEQPHQKIQAGIEKTPQKEGEELIWVNFYDEVCEFLSLDRDNIVDIQWIDNGPGWLGVLLASADRTYEFDH